MSESGSNSAELSSPRASEITRVVPGSRRPDPVTAAWAASAMVIGASLLCLRMESFGNDLVDNWARRRLHIPLDPTLAGAPVWGQGPHSWTYALFVVIYWAFPLLEIGAVIAGVGMLRGWRGSRLGMVICAYGAIAILLMRVVHYLVHGVQSLAHFGAYSAGMERSLGLLHQSELTLVRETFILYAGLHLVKTLLEMGFCGLLIRQTRRSGNAMYSVP